MVKNSLLTWIYSSGRINNLFSQYKKKIFSVLGVYIINFLYAYLDFLIFLAMNTYCLCIKKVYLERH
jgi:hypothetical protein